MCKKVKQGLFYKKEQKFLQKHFRKTKDIHEENIK